MNRSYDFVVTAFEHEVRRDRGQIYGGGRGETEV